MTRNNHVGDLVFTIILPRNDIVSSSLVVHRVPSPLVAERISPASGQKQ